MPAHSRKLMYDKSVGYWGMPMNSVIQTYITWNRVLSEANFWYCNMASSTFLWPPGTKHTAPKISRTATLVLMFSVLRLWATVLMLVGCANTWALPFCKTVPVQFSQFSILHLSLSKIIILDTVHFLGFFSKQNILETGCFHHQTQGSWEIVILVMLANIQSTTFCLLVFCRKT
jgi:hypothetical protein